MNSGQKIMNFGTKHVSAPNKKSSTKVIYNLDGLIGARSSVTYKKVRKISKKPFKIL